jgi:hypothetical protein
MGIEPTSEAWEACKITQKHDGLAAFSQLSKRLNWKIVENGKRLTHSELVRCDKESAAFQLIQVAFLAVTFAFAVD